METAPIGADKPSCVPSNNRLIRSRNTVTKHQHEKPHPFQSCPKPQLHLQKATTRNRPHNILLPQVHSHSQTSNYRAPPPSPHPPTPLSAANSSTRPNSRAARRQPHRTHSTCYSAAATSAPARFLHTSSARASTALHVPRSRTSTQAGTISSATHRRAPGQRAARGPCGQQRVGLCARC